MTLPGWPWPDLLLAWPWALLALPLPWLMRWWPRRVASEGAALRVPWSARQLQEIAGGNGRDGARIHRLLLWLGWCCLCVALARPQLLGEAVSPPTQARQLMLAMDVSGSMGEPDMVLGRQVVERR